MSTAEFDKVLVQNADFLKPFAINLTRDSEAANDLCWRPYIKPWLIMRNTMPGTNIKAWLFTIMRNIFINDYRRKAKQRTIFDNTPNDFLLNSQQVAVTQFSRRCHAFERDP